MFDGVRYTVIIRYAAEYTGNVWRLVIHITDPYAHLCQYRGFHSRSRSTLIKVRTGEILLSQIGLNSAGF